MKTVLLVDDSRTTRMVIARWLEEDGWQVFQADEGESGLELARQHRPGAIICDLLMPVVNGFQFCRSIRAQEDWPAQPRIVIASASEYETNRIAALEAGADEYLVKPLDRETLRAVLAPVIQADGVQPALDAVHTPTGQLYVKFWGVRGSIPTPGAGTVRYGGNTSCVEVRADDRIIILDAGSGLRLLGQQLMREFVERPIQVTVLITHTHWDHIQGFPFFAPAYQPRNKVCVLGVEGARIGIEGTLSRQMESPFFPLMMNQMPAHVGIDELRDKDMEFSLGAVRGRATFLNHPGVCIGYRLETSGGSIAYITDHEMLERYKVQTGKTSDEELQYAREQDERMAGFIAGTDILIMDSQYDRQEYETRAGWGHGCVDDVVALAVTAKVKRLFLFHHDPDHMDDYMDGVLKHARSLARKAGSAVEVFVAQEGTELRLPE